MTIVVLTDLICALSFGLGLIFALAIDRRHFHPISKIFLTLCVAIYFFVGSSNVLENLEITGALDPYEDYAELLFLPFFLFSVFYAVAHMYHEKRMAVEKALRDREVRYRTLIEDLPELYCRFQPDGILTFINKEYAEFFGKSIEECVGKSLLNLVPEPDRQPLRAHLDSFSPDHSVTRFEQRLTDAQQRSRWILWTDRAIFNDRQELIEFQSLGLEITKRKTAEDALRASQEQLTEAMRIARMGVWEWSQESSSLVFSDQIYSMLGFEPESFDGTFQGFLTFIPPDEREEVQARTVRALKGQDNFTIEHHFMCPSGRRAVLHSEATITRDPNGRAIGMLGFAHDVTEQRQIEKERRELELKMQHSQKLESLGVLAGGLAHDFNNLLVGVLGNADLALRTLAPTSLPHRYVQSIETAARRAADLSNQMLAYSGKGRFLIEPIDLSSLVDEMAHMVEVSVSKKAVIKYDLAPELPAIEADATQIRQVVLNLITNASESLAGRSGYISIATGVRDCDRQCLKDSYLDDELATGLYSYLEVADTGDGMDEETRSRIFDPFFTTKFTGRGLGLAAVLGIVRGHKGTIRLESEPDKGTRIRVFFPASDQPAKQRPETAQATEEWSGQGQVLLVDDDETVRVVGKRMLEVLGFKVLTANDGEEGVEAFRRHGREIAVVVLDLTMPGLDGKEAFETIREIDEDAKVILSSGYNEQETTSRFAGQGLAGFIQKPYTLDTLRQRLRHVLAQG